MCDSVGCFKNSQILANMKTLNDGDDQEQTTLVRRRNLIKVSIVDTGN